jgi:hypothetical protein
VPGVPAVPWTPPGGPRIASMFAPAGNAGHPTLQALMERQKELANRKGGAPQIQSWTQGAAHMLDKLFEGLEVGRTNRRLAEGNQVQADVLGSADPKTGLVNPDQIDPLTSWNPELAYKLLSDWRSQQNTNAELEIARGKAAADAATAGAWKPSDLGSLRDDYTKAATIYDTAAPSWQSMQEAATTALSPEGTVEGKGAADYNMIVGFAKLLDPNSVVREGEVQSASMTGGQLDMLNGWLNQWKGEGMLSDNVRKAIMTQANSRMQSYYDQVRAKRDWITGIATRNKVNPDDVVPPLADFTPWAGPEEADPANPDTPPDIDPNRLPSIAPDDQAAFDAVPPGSYYTQPGVFEDDGTTLMLFFKPRAVRDAGGGAVTGGP